MSERDDALLLRLVRDSQIPHVVIGGWAVISHGYVRLTRDIDLLVPDRPEVHDQAAALMASLHARGPTGVPIEEDDRIPESGWQLQTDHGRIDWLLEGLPPLDFDTVFERSAAAEMDGTPFRYAGLATIVAFKRLAGRPQDLQDLKELEAIHGPLPIEPVPGLDT